MAKKNTRVSDFNSIPEMEAALAYQNKLYKSYKASYTKNVKDARKYRGLMATHGALTGGIAVGPYYLKMKQAEARATKWQKRMRQAYASAAKIRAQLAVLKRAQAEGIDVGKAVAENEVGLGIRSTTARASTYLGVGGVILAAIAVVAIIKLKKDQKG